MNPQGRPGDSFLHPVILGFLFVWALNDHLLKAAFANVWTGKLSDVASLAVFPLIPVCCYEIGCAWRGVEARHTQRVLWLSLLATGAVMAGINTWQPMADSYRWGLGLLQWPFRSLWQLLNGAGAASLKPVFLTQDPTDLWTLPALVIPWWVASRSGR
jgi:hypothetical protein